MYKHICYMYMYQLQLLFITSRNKICQKWNNISKICVYLLVFIIWEDGPQNIKCTFCIQDTKTFWPCNLYTWYKKYNHSGCIVKTPNVYSTYKRQYSLHSSIFTFYMYYKCKKKVMVLKSVIFSYVFKISKSFF